MKFPGLLGSRTVLRERGGAIPPRHSPTVSTAYDYYGKENKNDGPTSEASGFITCPPNRVRLNLSFLSAGLALTSLFFVCVIGMMNE